ncbi:MAG: Dot/Icm T4SS effector Zinc-dependent metalloprotease LegP [Granulosicoccus sp.]
MAAKKQSRSKKSASKKVTKKQASRVSRTSKGTGEFPTGGKTATALIRDANNQMRALHYVEVDGMAVVEGDIILGTIEEVDRNTEVMRQEMRGELARGVVITGSNRRWTDCQVPFTIDATLTLQNRVTDAIAHWESNTNYRFIERTPANASQFPDFVTFRPSANCSSSVGRRVGQQFINLGPSCTTGNTIHEIGHTIGLWHEQSRADRDAFVTINFAKIIPAAVSNFNQQITDGDDVGPYDYGSIMHYPRTAFSIDGSETITPTDSSATIGQRNALSPGDIAAANSLCTPVNPGTPNKFIDDPLTTKFIDDQRTVNKFSDDPQTFKFSDDPQTTKFSDDPQTFKFSDDPQTFKFSDDPQTSKFSDDPQTTKFSDDPQTSKFSDDPQTTKFSDDPQTSKFSDDPQTSKFSDDPQTIKFSDDPQGTSKISDDGGTNKQLDDVKQPLHDKGPSDVGPIQPGSGNPRIPFALATPHHASPSTIAAAGGMGHQDPGMLGQAIDQLYQYVEQLAHKLSHDVVDADKESLSVEYQRALSELQQSIALFNQLSGRTQ